MTELSKLDNQFGRRINRTSKQLEKWMRANIGTLVLGDDGLPIVPDFSGTIETHHPNGRVHEQASIRRGKLSGPYRRYFDDGTLEHSCQYRAGEISSDFWPSGQPKHKQMKRGGLIVKEWYYPSGKLQKRYVSDSTGFAVEPVRFWHENGQLAEEVHTKEGDRLGPWLRFFEDGTPRLEAEYGEEETLIVRNAWDDERRQVVKDGDGVHHDDGRDISVSYKLLYESDRVHSRELRGGIAHGVETIWYDGVLWSTQEYVNGKLHGVSTTFYENGRVRSRSIYRNDEEIETEELPRFDDPRPAVRIEIEANEKLYQAWNHPLLDQYPRPMNLEQVQSQLEIPAFLAEVFERNQAGTLKEQYEDLNTFDDSVAYMVMVDERGRRRGSVEGCLRVFRGDRGSVPADDPATDVRSWTHRRACGAMSDHGLDPSHIC